MPAAIDARAPLGVVLLANWGLGAAMVRELHALPWVRLLLCVTRHGGGGDDPWRDAVRDQALALGVPVRHEDECPHEAVRGFVLEHGADLLLCHAHMRLLPREVFTAPRLGTLNVHASLLPRHRGRRPVHDAIRAGDAMTGLTCHVVTEDIDAGGIVHQVAFPLLPGDTVGDVIERQKEHLGELLCTALERAARPGFTARPQHVNHTE